MQDDQGFLVPSEEKTAAGRELSYDFFAGFTYQFEAGWICTAASGEADVPIIHLTLLAQP